MRQRYQRGLLRCATRKAAPDCWEFLWRENGLTGKRVRRTVVVGTVEEYPTRDLAEAAANGLRMQVNEDCNRRLGRRVLMGDLVDHYVQTELSEQSGWHAPSTRTVCREFLNRWVRPHWGEVGIRSVRTVAVGYSPAPQPRKISVLADAVLQRVIRPAALRAGITKRIGWHTFRHTFSTERYGRHEETRTPDLYRVKVAL